MPAPVIAFETAVIAIAPDERVVVALIGDTPAEEPGTCVAILLCSESTARALAATLGSATQAPEPP